MWQVVWGVTVFFKGNSPEYVTLAKSGFLSKTRWWIRNKMRENANSASIIFPFVAKCHLSVRKWSYHISAVRWQVEWTVFKTFLAPPRRLHRWWTLSLFLTVFRPYLCLSHWLFSAFLSSGCHSVLSSFFPLLLDLQSVDLNWKMTWFRSAACSLLYKNQHASSREIWTRLLLSFPLSLWSSSLSLSLSFTGFLCVVFFIYLR